MTDTSPALNHMTRRRELKYGPLALVTGASDGIGREFARELARRGYGLVLVARRLDRLEALAEELASAHGVAVDVLPFDLSQPDQVQELIRASAHYDIGLLVAAAGFGTSGHFTQIPVETELDMIDVNCRAVVQISHAMAKRFVRRRSGGMVLMSSLLAFQGVAQSANYAATKAFIQTFAEGLRAELRPQGVDVIACAPGPIASGFATRANLVMGMSQPASVVAAATLNALGRRGTIRPGFLAKALEASFTGMPRWGLTLILSKVMAGMARGPDSSTTATRNPIS